MKYFGQITSLAKGARLFLQHPTEIWHNVAQCAKCIWQVKVKRKPLIVLERWGGIGDLICLLSAVKALREKHRSCWMVIISPPGTRELAASTALADAASDAHSFFQWFVTRWVWRAVHYGPLLPDEYHPPRARRRHLADEFASALCVSADQESVHVTPKPAERKFIARRLRSVNRDEHQIIVIHPGPTWLVREWPLNLWIDLTERMTAELPAIIIQIGGDYSYSKRTFRPAHVKHAIDWTNQLTLMQTVALLERAAAFVGIDSGPLHIATVLGVPAVALFGPTDGRLTVPPRANVQIITGAPTCLGCHHHASGPVHWRTGCPNNITCMQTISPANVLTALRKALISTRARGRRITPSL